MGGVNGIRQDRERFAQEQWEREKPLREQQAREEAERKRLEEQRLKAEVERLQKEDEQKQLAQEKADREARIREEAAREPSTVNTATEKQLPVVDETSHEPENQRASNQNTAPLLDDAKDTPAEEPLSAPDPRENRGISPQMQSNIERERLRLFRQAERRAKGPRPSPYQYALGQMGMEPVAGPSGQQAATYDVLIDTDEQTVSVPNFLKNTSAKSGSDGVAVLCPLGWLTIQGRDGRLVTYPSSWKAKKGRDGRAVAYPPTWTAREGGDGRVVVRPSNWTYKEGGDGRVVARPYSWTYKEGGDGRVVARPYGSQNGIKRNGRLLTYSNTNGRLTLLFPDLEKNALFEELKKNLTGKELFDYIQYVYLNEYVSTKQSANSRPSAQIAPPDGSVHRVLKVWDGDTIVIDTVEGPLRVRVVGIDTPETIAPFRPVGFWGPEASGRAKQLLTGQMIRIHYDTLPNSQRWDKYGRLLAYVELANGYDFGLIMVREGHARVNVRYPCARQPLYLEAEQAARSQRLGVWSE